MSTVTKVRIVLEINLVDGQPSDATDLAHSEPVVELLDRLDEEGEDFSIALKDRLGVDSAFHSYVEVVEAIDRKS